MAEIFGAVASGAGLLSLSMQLLESSQKLKSFYDTTAKKCKCPGGKQFRQGQCRDTPCPTIPYNSYYNTRYDPVAEKCVCLKNNNTPDNSKTFYENYGLCF